MKEENQEKKDIKKNKIGAVILFFTAIFSSSWSIVS